MDDKAPLEQGDQPTEVVANTEPVSATAEKTTETKWYKSRKFMAASALALLLIVGGGVFALSGNEEESEVAETEEVSEETVSFASTIALSEGTVEYSTDGETWTASEGNETISVGEYVRTLDESRAIVLLDDGSAVRIDENSQIKLMTADSTASEIMLVSGQAYTRVAESTDRVFAVVTANERFEAMGTAYKTSTDGDTDTLQVFQSTVMVASDDIEIQEGNEYDTKEKTKKSIDLEKLTDDEFVQWNKEKDSEDSEFKNKLGVLSIEVKEENKEEEKPIEETPTPDPAAAISLSGATSDKGVTLTWSNSGVSASDGYKIVYDKNDTTPSYGENAAQYAGAGSSSFTVSLDDGNKYTFRVCAYRPSTSSCSNYSNAVTITAPVIKKEAVKAGAVNLSLNGAVVSWTYSGTAPHGFKVTMNRTGTPAYPGDSVAYVGTDKSTFAIPTKDEGSYFLRVCKYTADPAINGGCTDYSNEVEYDYVIAP